MDCSLFLFCLLLIDITMVEVLSNPVKPTSNNIASEGHKNSGKSKISDNVILNGPQSFEEAVLKMDKILADDDDGVPCAMYEAPDLNFKEEGRRISEAKCLENIWNIKKDEDMDRRVSECRKQFKDFTGIVGGRTAEPGEFPHMGALGWKAKKGGWTFMCGSILVNEKFVLTAAHCLLTENENVAHPRPKIVRFGVENINNLEKNFDHNPIDIKILEHIHHPKYRPEPFKAFDIGLIKLRTRVEFSDFVRPACLLNQEINKAIISGWGVADSNSIYDDKISDELLTTEVDIISRKECNAKLTQKQNKFWNTVLKSQICATKMDGVGDICAGDSGGPLQTKLDINTKKSIYNVVGITSFGFSTCGHSMFPSVYTNVSSFIDWIEEVVWDVKPSKPTVDEDDSSESDEVSKVKEGRRLEPENEMTIQKAQVLPEGVLFWLDKLGSYWTYVNNKMIEIVK